MFHLVSLTLLAASGSFSPSGFIQGKTFEKIKFGTENFMLFYAACFSKLILDAFQGDKSLSEINKES